MGVEGKLMSLVDLDAPPFVPDGWEVESHKTGAPVLNFNKQFQFYLAPAQRKGYILGHDLRKELEHQAVVNANVLDYLLTGLIARSRVLHDRWKHDEHYQSRYIFFWGTIYRFDGDLCVRCLHWNNLKWESSYGWLSSQWNSYYHALVYA